MELQKIEALKSALNKTAGKALILSHKNPDGDALGSSIGWQAYLKQKGWEAEIVLPNEFPDFLSWLPGADQVVFAEEIGEAAFIDKCDQADYIFCLDFNHSSRIAFGDQLMPRKDKVVMIDHHLEPESFAHIEFSEPKCCATAELIVKMIEAIDGELKISKEGATGLYVGLLTDTGSFRFPSTTAYTFRAAASLIEQGADNADIYQKIFDTNSLNRLKLLGSSLSKGMTIYEDKGAALITLSTKDMQKHNFKKGDSEGFVNYPLSVKSIQLAALFKEDKEIVKISLRSKGDLAVNTLSQKYFQGGGHKNAAGGKFDGSLEDAVKQFEKMLDEI